MLRRCQYTSRTLLRSLEVRNVFHHVSHRINTRLWVQHPQYAPLLHRQASIFPGARRRPGDHSQSSSDNSIDEDFKSLGLDEEDYVAGDPLDVIDNRQDPDYPTEEEIKNATIPTNLDVYFVRVTCRTCETRSGHFISQAAYNEGTIIIFCPGCDTGHIFVDNLQAFSDDVENATLQDVMRISGDLIAKGNRGFHRDSVMEFRPPGPMGLEELDEHMEQMQANAEIESTNYEEFLESLDERDRQTAMTLIEEMRLRAGKVEEDDEGWLHDRQTDVPGTGKAGSEPYVHDEDVDSAFGQFFKNDGSDDVPFGGIDRPVTPEESERINNMTEDELQDALKELLAKYREKKGL
ncbi:DNL zinc finger-domain-containing protein [Lipomyces tetrasporus]|uniref:DNL zinc finger-domain-containing protein n=1 Tax=Lipomyces tetrasporus TaxID=54092 RepID=A0AAD7QK12_9ASCO|nr:DNL zinc finger-domain-containing protein [Lipomyces tetrasporus]KAJ8096643.1 DNL zinc finger-domain-containing protein [Lipomyces tetrasporus]